MSRRSPDPVIRLTHATGGAAMIVMILSGWQIYNASPILPFVFPHGVTLGGWLAAGIAWHIAAMWVLLASGLVYLIWGALTGHFSRALLPIRAGDVGRDAAAALRLQLPHTDLGAYNAVQKLFYVAVLAAAVLAVLTGLAIWKPVQFGPLSWLFGGYDIARRIHFAAMCSIVAFLAVHLALVAVVPSTLKRITVGLRAPDAEPAPAAETKA